MTLVRLIFSTLERSMREYFRFLVLGSAPALVLVSGCSREEDVVDGAAERSADRRS
jgi:hypothetical protein